MHIVITGAGRGIGAALARDYAARGDNVTATSRGGETGVTLDVTDPAQHAALAPHRPAPGPGLRQSAPAVDVNRRLDKRRHGAASSGRVGRC